MTDKPSVMNVGDAIIEGLEEAVAWKGGELTLPVLNIPDDYAIRIRAMRKSLGFRSREAFEKAYGIPAKTLQNWEQGRVRPDQTERAFLRVIEADPESVRRPLAAAL